MFFTGFRTTPGGGCMWDAGGGGGDSGRCAAVAAGPPSVADMARCSALPLADVVDEDCGGAGGGGGGIGWGTVA